MTLPPSLGTRVFLTAWIVFSLHFVTNTVREHYPAFSLVEDGTHASLLAANGAYARTFRRAAGLPG